MSERPLKVGLHGCPPGTGNLGVDALRISMIDGLINTGVNMRIDVFDYGSGIRESFSETGAPIKLVGASFSRRFYSTSNLQQMLFASRLGIGHFHPILNHIRSMDLLCDITGGDSFTDLYGKRRFRYGTIFKDLIIANNLPLILLPQTYGPFWRKKSISKVGKILRSSSQVWARDSDSLKVAADLSGRASEANNLGQTIDVAFGLPSKMPDEKILVERLLRLRDSSNTLVGINVSGLLYNLPGYASSQFGFQTDYIALVDRLLEELLSEQATSIVLIPHVSDEGKYKHDNDAQACRTIMSKLPRDARRRVLVVPSKFNAVEMKWVIGQMDWMCATRMHAAIAAISQGIATAAIAYSDKTFGVFKTASAEDSVFDPRFDLEREIVDAILEHYATREKHSAILEAGSAQRAAMLKGFFRSIVVSQTI